MNLYVTVLLFTLEILVAYAYPYGAGTCAAGNPIISPAPHLDDGALRNGYLTIIFDAINSLKCYTFFPYQIRCNRNRN